MPRLSAAPPAPLPPPPRSADCVAQVLGFHFFRCREEPGAQPPRPARPAPEGLYLAAAQLVAAGHCSLEALMAHLLPADDDLKSGGWGEVWGWVNGGDRASAAAASCNPSPR